MVAGDIVAGPHVRDACARHLRDLAQAKRRGLVWDKDAALWAFEYFETVLRLNGGEFEGQPFVLADWQQFVVGSLMGWKLKDGWRRFRVAYIETAKGSGKSPLVAGLGLYGLTADDEARAEVYAAAVKQDQAKVLFRDAIAMVQQSPALSDRLLIGGGQDPHNIAHEESGSFFRPISSEERGRGQSGPRPHIALLDEVHEHPTNAMVEFLRAGTKSRRQALIAMITNSGASRTSVCFEYHEYARKVCAGDIEDDGFFGYVCALDDGDDPFEDESCWPKANPSLPVVPGYKYLREQVREAKGLPSKEALVRRLNFCQWTDAVDGWLTHQVWAAVERELVLEDFVGCECALGLDMSYTSDLSALAAVIRGPDRWHGFVRFFKPAEGLREAGNKDRVDYDLWAKQGHLTLTPGRVIKLGPIAELVGWFADNFDLKVLAYDRYRHRELADEMADAGVIVPMMEHPQGFRRAGVLRDANGEPVLDEDGKPRENPLWMPGSVQGLENAIVESDLEIEVNPVLRWNVSSVVIRDDPAGTGNRVFDKRRATGRIDGCVALAMAYGAAVAGTSLDEPDAPFVMWA